MRANNETSTALKRISSLLILFRNLDSELEQKPKKQNNQDQTTMSSKELNKLQKGNQQLQEENNLLRVKNDLLLDMIAEVYSEMKLEHEERKN